MVLFFNCGACAPHVQDDTSLETLDQLQGNPGTDPVDEAIDSATVVPSPEGAQEGRNASPTLNGSDDPPPEPQPLALENPDVSPVVKATDSETAVSLVGGSIFEENSRTGQTASTGASKQDFDAVALGSSGFRRLGATRSPRRSPRRSWNNVSWNNVRHLHCTTIQYIAVALNSAIVAIQSCTTVNTLIVHIQQQ